MEKNDFYINIFAIFVEEIFKEMRDRLVGDVSTDDNMPESYT